MNIQSDSAISAQLIDAAITSIHDGNLFEKLIQQLLFNQGAGNIIPVGGMHDGGRDAYIYSDGQNDFFQISIQKTWKTKVNQTIQALKASGLFKSARKIHFYFSFSISEDDRTELQEKIWNDEKVNIQINALEYLRFFINNTIDSRRIFLEFCALHTIFEKFEITTAEVFPQNALDKTLVLLRHLVQDNNIDDDNYIETVCKSHLYLYLKETDPDTGVFRKIDEIQNHILKQLHGSTPELIAHSLANIFTKDGKLDREAKDFRIYPDGRICLSYRVRQRLLTYQAQDVTLLSDFKEEISNQFEHFDLDTRSKLVAITLGVLIEIFKRQGLIFVQHINGTAFNAKEEDLRAVCHSVVDKSDIPANIKGQCISEVTEVIYDIIWRPSSSQKEFLIALSKTYSLMFIGKADAQVLNFLDSTAKGLTLLLGTDIVVRVLAEVLLPPEKQRFTTLVRSLKASGVKLNFTDGILREAGAHVRSTITWYETHVQMLLSESQNDPIIQDLVDFEERYSRKVLVRAFYHARVGGKVKTLEDFLSNFVGSNPNRFNTDILEYFEGQFEITKPSIDIDPDDARFKTLIELFVGVTHQGHDTHVKRRIATNDAETVHTVYTLRTKIPPPPKKHFLLPEPIWWLTAEFKADKLTSEFEKRYSRPPHIHPEVIVGLLANLPELKANHKQIDQILSGAIGLQMSHWVSDEVVSQVTLSYDEIRSQSPGKKNQLIGQLLTKLKNSRVRPIRAHLSSSYQKLASDKQYINTLILKRVNLGPPALWEYIKENIKDDLARIYFFKEGICSDTVTAVKLLRENGYSSDVKGIQAVILDQLIGTELSD